MVDGVSFDWLSDLMVSRMMSGWVSLSSVVMVA